MTPPEVRQSPNPLAVLLDATRQMDEQREIIARLAAIRSEALREAHKTMSAAEIARQLNISRQQVHRLLRRGR